MRRRRRSGERPTTTVNAYYKYAQLATAAYVDLGAESDLSNSARLVQIADAQGRMPEALGIELFQGESAWSVLGDPRHFVVGEPGQAPQLHHDDPVSGFAATLFRNNATGGKVLAIRGTDPARSGQLYQDLIRADLVNLGLFGLAYNQVTSLFNLVQRLKAPAGQADVLQLEVRKGGLPPVDGNFIGHGGAYYWLEARYDGIGQGVMARRMFPELFSQAVIFNSPGYDPVTSAGLTRHRDGAEQPRHRAAHGFGRRAIAHVFAESATVADGPRQAARGDERRSSQVRRNIADQRLHELFRGQGPDPALPVRKQQGPRRHQPAGGSAGDRRGELRLRGADAGAVQRAAGGVRETWLTSDRTHHGKRREQDTGTGSRGVRASARRQRSTRSRGQSDQPVLSNFTAVHPASGVAIVDFGFLDPGGLNAISQLARSGKKIPERINGRLGVRVALPYDVLAGLHQQIGRLLQAMTKGRKPQ